MTLVLGEADVANLLTMSEVVSAVEDSFKHDSRAERVNSARTRSVAGGTVLNVMHASLPYLGRAGVKCYLSSRRGTSFVFILFGSDDPEPLAFMGADNLGRFRTGAASAVATKYLYGHGSFRFAIAGSGKQALTQVLAMREVASLETTKVWSPNSAHLDAFLKRLSVSGVEAVESHTLREAFAASDVGTTITSSKSPFVGLEDAKDLVHLNICGSNWQDKAEATPEAVASFATIVVDDLEQAKQEAGDLIAADREGTFHWQDAVELSKVVSGSVKPGARTLFKSTGVAAEDVAVASLVYDKARKSGAYRTRELKIGI
jgi:ornithine cyclodeaminase/alanine dehydrogenase-like protein (mu-crystallin family)